MAIRDQSSFNPTKDATSFAAIYNGCTAKQLREVFKVPGPMVNAAIARVKPCGKSERGADLYHIRDVALYLVKDKLDAKEIRDTIMQMHFTELPTLLKKEFWAGERLRQDYEIKNGDLWPTTQVIEYVAELYKIVQMSAKLASDNVERTVELTDRQRAIIKSHMDGMLDDLRRKIEENFRGKGRKRTTEDMVDEQRAHDMPAAPDVVEESEDW